jgi:alginate O-acetyltransferase complex protein AlgI
MLFNSFIFLLFFPIVFGLYWFILKRNLKAQNFFLLVVSYVFYGWWDWRFLLLIAFSSSVDFFVANQLSLVEDKIKRKVLLWTSLTVNLGLLGFFKYANFFIDSFSELLANVGMQVNYSSLQIILPVGISFYTFQTLSYTLDVYAKKMEPTKDPIAFFAYVSFFPQLVAGPIERAANLLPQFFKSREFNYVKAKDASRQILWGFFKKMVIADTCASHVDYIFGNHGELQASLLVLGVIYFAFQIYGDFSGYSDIAIGTARLLGFDLMTNFKTPYFSRNVAEFWKRWHISLSTWFRDYVYIPLGGNRRKLWRNVFNVMVVFTVSGFWHGANWTFIIWGALNGLFFIPLFLLGKNKVESTVVAQNRLLPSFKDLIRMGSTFFLICTAWVFFRAESVGKALQYLSNTVDTSILSSPGNPNLTLMPIILIPLLLLIEWLLRNKEHQFDISGLPIWLRWPAYYILIAMIIQFGQGDVSFIYFQF